MPVVDLSGRGHKNFAQLQLQNTFSARVLMSSCSAYDVMSLFRKNVLPNNSFMNKQLQINGNCGYPLPGPNPTTVF